MYNINRRKFLGLFGCTCCSIILPSCSTVPITERKQLSIIPEATINRQAAQAYENFKSKTKLITSGSKLKEIKHGFFNNKGGCSTGIYKSLNCGPGSNDYKTKVFKNLRIVLVTSSILSTL